MAWQKAKGWFQNLITIITNHNTHIALLPNISRSKGNQTIKFGHPDLITTLTFWWGGSPPQRLCWLEHCLLVGSPMPDRWRGRDQTKSDQLTVACRQSVVSVAISDRLEYWFVLHRSLSFMRRGSNSQVRWLLQLSRGLATLDHIATEKLLRQYGKSYKQH